MIVLPHLQIFLIKSCLFESHYSLFADPITPVYTYVVDSYILNSVSMSHRNEDS